MKRRDIFIGLGVGGSAVLALEGIVEIALIAGVVLTWGDLDFELSRDQRIIKNIVAGVVGVIFAAWYIFRESRKAGRYETEMDAGIQQTFGPRSD